MAEDARPKREQKVVQAFAPAEIKVTEDLVVPQGSGEKLGDIENVKIKIEKFNGASEELKTLHRLCYGRVGKQTTIKKFLRDFSGFASGEDMEKKELHAGTLEREGGGREDKVPAFQPALRSQDKTRCPRVSSWSSSDF